MNASVIGTGRVGLVVAAGLQISGSMFTVWTLTNLNPLSSK